MSTTGVADPASTTAGESEPHGEHADCLYRNDVMFVGGRAGQSLPTDELTELDPQAFAEVLGVTSGQDRELLGELLSRDEGLVPYAISQRGDPLAIASSLRGQGFDASPILLTTVSGHWMFAGGDDPVRLPDDPGITVGSLEAKYRIAVVDTGYEEDRATPEWLAERVSPASSGGEPEGALPDEVRGHGKFVASIIAQEAPNAEIVVAGMSDVTRDRFYGDLPKDADTGYTTDEVRLFLAVGRLLDAAANDPYDVLNLSLGTYVCPDLPNSGLAVRAAIDLWTDAMPDAPIVAAAGNHNPSEMPTTPFIPAAFVDDTKNLVAVASVDAAGVLSVFSNDADVSAIGEHLVGVREDGYWDAWSGTSFAAAVVSAHVAENATLPAPGIVALVNVRQYP